MIHDAIKAKLADPVYAERHFAAVAALSKTSANPWYDSRFLRRFEAAQLYLQLIEPLALRLFADGFAELQLAGNAKIKSVSNLFDDATAAQIKADVAAIPASHLASSELAEFGRHIVHDHPRFVELQRALLPRVSEWAGRELELGYNFLSLYGLDGRCAPHMDQPVSMYTLDYCIDQNTIWPISYSNPVAWPRLSETTAVSPRKPFEDPDLRWEEFEISPNGALFFCGSSRWHYRDRIASGGFCNLLFLHYYPAGSEGLVKPQLWAEHFEIEALQPLCDLFEDSDARVAG